MKQFGLIGKTLKHSFSENYFTEKFKQLNLSDSHNYSLFELETIKEFPLLLEKHKNLVGINVTIPYKLEVLPFLNELDHSAKKVGAVNVIKFLNNGNLKGYNSDYYGFKNSLSPLLKKDKKYKALIFGNGGATRAIKAALEDLGFEYKIVSRRISEETITYQQSNDLVNTHQLLINCTPLGTYPKSEGYPPINYEAITNNHVLFDLVYNPTETVFLKKGLEKGAKGTNGYQMLVLQAEKSWEIWNT